MFDAKRSVFGRLFCAVRRIGALRLAAASDERAGRRPPSGFTSTDWLRSRRSARCGRLCACARCACVRGAPEQWLAAAAVPALRKSAPNVLSRSPGRSTATALRGVLSSIHFVRVFDTHARSLSPARCPPPSRSGPRSPPGECHSGAAVSRNDESCERVRSPGVAVAPKPHVIRIIPLFIFAVGTSILCDPTSPCDM